MRPSITHFFSSFLPNKRHSKEDILDSMHEKGFSNYYNNIKYEAEMLDSANKERSKQISEASSRIIQKLSDNTELRRIVEILEDASLDSLVIVDRLGYITSVNQTTLRMFGYSLSDLGRVHITDLIPLFKVTDRSEVYTDAIGIRKDASEFSIEILSNYISSIKHNEQTVDKRFLIIIRDMSDARQLIDKNKQLGSFVDLLVSNSPNPIFHKNANLKYLGGNKLFEELVGLPLAAIFDKTDHDIFPKEIAAFSTQKDYELLHKDNKEPQVYTCKMRSKFNTNEMEVMVYKSPIFGADDEINGIIGTIIDLTEYLKARRSASLFEAVLNETATPIFIMNENDVVVFANKTLLNKLDLLQEEVTNKSCFSFLDSIESDFITLKDGTKVKSKLITVPCDHTGAKYTYIVLD